MDWLEFLIPIIFILLWIFGSRSGKKEEEDATPQAQRRKNEAEGQEEGGSASPSDEARRIQEEIRRLIVSRQGGSAESQGSAPQNQQHQRIEGEKASAQMETGQRSMGQDPHRPDRASATKSMESLDGGGRRRAPADDSRSRMRQEDSSLERLRREEEMLKEKEQEAARLRQKAAAMQRAAGANAFQQAALSKATGGLNRSELQRLLRHPDSARNAFLLMEILGTPVGQRRDDSIKPFWKS